MVVRLPWIANISKMSYQYILPVVDHLLEEEIDAELGLRKQSVDQRETLDDKKRLLRRLFKEDRSSGTGYEGVHKFSEEIRKVSETVDELVSSLRKRADRVQVSRLRHYLLRLARASVEGNEEEIARNEVCDKIFEVFRGLGERVREEVEEEDEEDIRKIERKKDANSKLDDQKGKFKIPEPACLSGIKGVRCDCAWCQGKGARAKDPNLKSKGLKEEKQDDSRKTGKNKGEEENKKRDRKEDKRGKNDRRKSRRGKRHNSTDDSCTEEEEKGESWRDRRGKNDRRRSQVDTVSESEYESDVDRKRRNRRDRKRSSSGRRHRRRSSSSSSESSDRDRHRHRKSRVENWNLYFAGDNRSMQVEDFLYKIKKLARHEGVSDRELLRNIHHRLKGEAYDWWFTKEDRFSRWSKFEDEIRFRYGNPNRDRGIKAQIRELKQRRGETFIAYVTEVEKLNQCLQRPFSSRTLFELVWENMRPHYRSRLSIMDIYDLEQLIRVNHKIDASDPSFYRSPSNVRGDMHHLEAEDSDDEGNEGFDVPVRAIQRTQREGRQTLPPRSQPNPASNARPDQQRSASTVSCWNCQRTGHIWRDCTERKIIFCYACGKVGRTTRTCENNHYSQNNVRTRQQSTN